jgi:small subunit ribosomal protein S6
LPARNEGEVDGHELVEVSGVGRPYPHAENPSTAAGHGRGVAMVARSMARVYDLMVLIDPNAPEEQRSAVVSEVESSVGADGELVGEHDWGQRRLAYEIDHRPEAEYRLFQIRAGRELLQRLDQRLKIMDGVLRFRIIRSKGDPAPPPPPQRSEAPRVRQEEPEGRVAARAAADAPAR